MRYYLILIALVSFSVSDIFAMPKKISQKTVSLDGAKKSQEADQAPSLVSKSAPQCSSLYDSCKTVCNQKFTLPEQKASKTSSSKDSSLKEISKENELCQSSCVKGLASCGEGEQEVEEIVIKGFSSSPKSTQSVTNSSMLQWEFEKGCQEGCDIGSSSTELKGKEAFKKKCKKVCAAEVR